MRTSYFGPKLACASLGLFAAAIPAFAATSEDVADFYADKQIRMIVSTAAGSDYDTWARLITRHWGKHIPGHPTFLIQNMPGAGGIIAANSLYNTAPRDGLTIAMIGRNLAYQSLLKQDGIRFEAKKFNWIGSPEVSNRICVAMPGAKVQDARALFDTELLVGGAGAGTAVTTTPRLLSKLLGMKFRVVEGYGSANNVQLAMEKGELEGICQTVSSLRAWHADWLASGKLKVLFNMERQPLPEFGAPSVQTFATTPEQRKVLAIYSSSVELGRPIVAPPDVPADRVRALRDGFRAALQDPDLLQEARKLHMDVTLVSGEDLELLINDLMSTPPEILDSVKSLSQ